MDTGEKEKPGKAQELKVLRDTASVSFMNTAEGWTDLSSSLPPPLPKKLGGARQDWPLTVSVCLPCLSRIRYLALSSSVQKGHQAGGVWDPGTSKQAPRVIPPRGA